MSIFGLISLKIWINVIFIKQGILDDIFTFIENEYYLMPRKIECIEVNDQIDEYLKQIDRMSQKVVGI